MDSEIEKFKINFQRTEIPKLENRAYKRGYRDGCDRTREDMKYVPWYRRLFNKF